jgi:riboflavin kinase/FMN adenylyltransferase
LDFDKDIYGKEIEVFFIKKIRNEKKFSTVEELVAEMKKDLLKTKNYFGSEYCT